MSQWSQTSARREQQNTTHISSTLVWMRPVVTWKQLLWKIVESVSGSIPNSECVSFTFFHHAFSNPPTILNYCESPRCKTPSFRWGFHSDLNETFFIGDCDEDSQRLVRWGAVRADEGYHRIPNTYPIYNAQHLNFKGITNTLQNPINGQQKHDENW